MKYTTTFKKAVLRKVLPPENRSVHSVSKEMGVGEITIHRWISQIKDGTLNLEQDEENPSGQRNMTEKLNLLLEYQKIPRVSDDNPFIESFFKTLKYRCGYPHHFESIEHARNWFADFIHWYNFEHKHSGLQFVTPMQKRNGEHFKVYKNRNIIIRESSETESSPLVNRQNINIFIYRV